jgi:hypothetical protein
MEAKLCLMSLTDGSNLQLAWLSQRKIYSVSTNSHATERISWLHSSQFNQSPHVADSSYAVLSISSLTPIPQLPSLPPYIPRRSDLRQVAALEIVGDCPAVHVPRQVLARGCSWHCCRRQLHLVYHSHWYRVRLVEVPLTQVSVSYIQRTTDCLCSF